MKSKYLIFLFIISFCFTFNVNAESVSCTYENSDNSSDTRTFLIYTKEEDKKNGGDSIDIPGYGDVKYGNNFTNVANSNASYPSNSFFLHKYSEFNNADEYYSQNGCPPYFYVTDADGNSYVGYFSDKTKDDLSGLTISASYKNVDSNVKKDESGNITPTTIKKGCDYTTTDGFTTALTINITDKKFYFSSGNFLNQDDYIKNFTFSETDQQCPDDLYACYTPSPVGGVPFKVIRSFSEKELYTNEVCSLLIDTGKEFTIGTNFCAYLYTLKIEYDNYINLKNYDAADKIILDVKNYCSIILKYQDYSNYEYSCMYLCLNASKNFASRSDKTDISECGFSNRLLTWIKNIMRWIKYILPVLVIVLSILDFIKAVGADKDDEMKKAQGKFTKRLIAAALAFLIPLIIEFVLGVMGFDSNGCGIIAL